MSAASERRKREVDRIRRVYRRRVEVGTEHKYSLFEPAYLFQCQSLERALLQSLRQEGLHSLAGMRILDVGCGDGAWLRGLLRYGAEPGKLAGVDLSISRGTPAAICAPALASADLLPFASGSFDLVCQLTMMSSVLDAVMRGAIAQEMLRVLTPSGLLLWYDFTVNPWNRDTRGIGARELRALFTGAHVRVRRVTLAPPLTRLLAPRLWPACSMLEQIPLLRTHLLASVRRASG